MLIAVPSSLPWLLRPVLFQSVGLAVTALVVALLGETAVALAYLFGGGVSMVNTGLLYLRWHKGVRDFHCDTHRHLRSFYRSGMERFFVVVMLLAAGFVLMGDHPLALLAGFVVGQMALMLASLILRERT